MNSPAAKVAIVFLIIGGFVAWAAWPSHLRPPVEANRVTHPAGYSIIRPPDWDAKIQTNLRGENLDRIALEPATPGKWDPGLTVTRLAHPPDAQKLKDVEGFVSGQFQGGDALLFTGKVKRYHVWRAIFERDGNWFDLMLSLQTPEDVPHGDWWPYVMSFRYAGGSATTRSSPVTLPTTLPLHF